MQKVGHTLYILKELNTCSFIRIKFLTLKSIHRGIFFFMELVEKADRVGKSTGMCRETSWLIAVGVQWLEWWENWIEVRKINHIAQTDKNERFRCNWTKISRCKLNGSSKEALDSLIQTLPSAFITFSFLLLHKGKNTPTTEGWKCLYGSERITGLN